MSQRIIGCMASIPEREHILSKSVESVLGQVDQLHVILNNYEHIPKYLNHPKIKAELGDNYRGCCVKMKYATTPDVYYFTFDDDLIYSPTYVRELVNYLKLYDDKVVVGTHGGIFSKTDIERSFHFAYAENSFWLVDTLGTGTTAFHTSHVMPTMDDFPQKNELDLQFGLFCRKNDIRMYIVPHKSGSIKEHPEAHKTPSLWSQSSVEKLKQRWFLHTKNI